MRASKPAPRIVIVAGPPPAGDAFDLHISRRARERFQLDQSLFSTAGGVIFADVASARRLADTLARELSQLDQELSLAVTPAKVYALGLIHELMHQMIERYRQAVDSGVLSEALSFLEERFGAERLALTLQVFAREFPPLPVWRGEVGLEQYLASETAGRSNREVLLEEMLILWLANSSPAFAPFRELFDDGALRRESAYPEVISSLEEFLASEPPYPEPEPLEDSPRPSSPPQSLFEALRAPAREEPVSLSGQLRTIAETYVPPPPPGPVSARQLRATDLLREEERPVFPPGPGPVEPPPTFEVEAQGPEQFSPDLDWMPRLVLIAKNTLVWLSQLSVQYGQEITRLDEIPEAELELLARRGFTGLWLIGLWQRSTASQRIKQLCGNPDAAASAYSLDSYQIADDLGGDEALEAFRQRATRHGIRLACDMVPNHFGLDSRWVLEHPERFLQLPTPPYRSYRFTGPNLSPDPDIGLHLEDHYLDRSDAAVVFERIDRKTGEVAYLYHGNDGTVTPWNDTAQLDYLQTEVRAAVMETILEVARRFPIIRFDAAMTLARRHVRRLWYPPPGSGGAIPSRSEHGLSEEEFDALMPNEFWREVVDRVALEVPDTLLLAEAFWLMESFFVRTLGMHRVYNSAFMNMLREERNEDYRTVVKNVLAFEPEILKRYVNFMSNPDERSALEQFGGSDKYFGVATVLVALPGLPMFAHGQVEGLSERYGMEYTRSYKDEATDPWIVARHERQIVPLLHRRDLFAGSEHFVLFDFEKSLGLVDDDVLAFTNRLEDERSLVVFHNRPGPTRGRIRRSVPIAFAIEGAEKPHLRWETLGHALGLEDTDPNGRKPLLLSCRDAVTGHEHLFDPREILAAGLPLSLGGYECHVFLDFQPLFEDAAGAWTALALALGGRGVPSLAEALLEPQLEAVLAPFRLLVEPELLHRFLAAATSTRLPEPAARLLDEVEVRYRDFLLALARHLGETTPEEEARLERLAHDGRLALVIALDAARGAQSAAKSAAAKSSSAEADSAAEDTPIEPLQLDLARPTTLTALYVWTLLAGLAEVALPVEAGRARAALDDLLLGKQLAEGLRGLGSSADEARDATLELKVLAAGALPPLAIESTDEWSAWLAQSDVRLYLRLNRFEGWTYFHRESFERLLGWALLAAELEAALDPADLSDLHHRAATWAKRAEEAGYRLEPFLDVKAEEEKAPG